MITGRGAHCCSVTPRGGDLDEPRLDWERREGETPKQFQAFVVFRDLGLGRSIDAAYRQHTRRESNTAVRAHNQWRMWARANEWFARAEAYDRYLDAEKRRQREAEHSRMIEEHSKRTRDISQLKIDLANRLLAKLGIAIDQLDAEALDAKAIAALLNAGSRTGTAGIEAEAHALGIEQLTGLIDSENG